MKTIERSSVCLTDRFGNYIQAGGYKDTFVQINDFKIRVPKSQILSKNQVCELFQEFTDEIRLENSNIFWKKIEI